MSVSIALAGEKLAMTSDKIKSELSQIPFPTQTRFTDFLIRENDLAENGFER